MKKIMSEITRPLGVIPNSLKKEPAPEKESEKEKRQKEKAREEIGTAPLSKPASFELLDFGKPAGETGKKKFDVRTTTPKEIARREELRELIRNNANFFALRATIQSSISASIEERPIYENTTRVLLQAILRNAEVTQKEFEDVLDAIRIEIVESGLSEEDEQGVKAFQEFMEAAFQDSEFWDPSSKKEIKRIEDEIITGTLEDKSVKERVRKIVERVMDNTIIQGTTVLFSVPENMSATNVSFQERTKKEYIQTTSRLSRGADQVRELMPIETIGKTRNKGEVFPKLREHEIEEGEKILEVTIPPDARFIRRDTEGKIQKRLNTAKQKTKYDEIAKDRTEMVFNEIEARLAERMRIIQKDSESQEVLQKLKEALEQDKTQEEYERISNQLNEVVRKASIKDLQEELRKRREKEWGI